MKQANDVFIIDCIMRTHNAPQSINWLLAWAVKIPDILLSLSPSNVSLDESVPMGITSLLWKKDTFLHIWKIKIDRIKNLYSIFNGEYHTLITVNVVYV